MCHAVADEGFARTLADLARDLERSLTRSQHFGHTCRNRDQRSAEIRVSTQQQRCQAGNQPLPVIHLTEERYDLPVICRALHWIATEKTCYAQQIQRLSDSVLILHLLENGQRLLMAAQRFMRLLDIQVPVAQSVEAVGKQFRIGKRLRQVKRSAKKCAHSFIVTSCPQEAKVDQALPFCCPILSGTGSL